MALQDYSRSTVASGAGALQPKVTEIDIVNATMQRASGVLDRLNALADRLAGPAPECDVCRDGGTPDYIGVIPNLARSARSLDDEMDRAVESLNRIERLI